ncbi:MAG: hypothetical protein U1F52_10045 [Burkholderiales bacterium]
MASDKTRRILTALSNGTDPFTGRDFPADSPYQHPDVVRALFHALQQLELSPAAPVADAGTDASAAPQRKQSPRAGNAGRPWSPAEDTNLAQGFDAGDDLDTLAARLQRSRFAVEVRLAKLERLPMPENTRFSSLRAATSSASSTPRVEQPARDYRVAA